MVVIRLKSMKERQNVVVIRLKSMKERQNVIVITLHTSLFLW